MSDLIDPAELRERQSSEDPPIVVDVRNPQEYEQGHVPGSINVPTDELPDRLGEISSDRPIVPY